MSLERAEKMPVRERIRDFALLIRIGNSLFPDLGNFLENVSNLAGPWLRESAVPRINREIPCIFPGDQGIRPQRVVRARLHHPATSHCEPIPGSGVISCRNRDGPQGKPSRAPLSSKERSVRVALSSAFVISRTVAATTIATLKARKMNLRSAQRHDSVTRGARRFGSAPGAPARWNSSGRVTSVFGASRCLSSAPVSAASSDSVKSPRSTSSSRIDPMSARRCLRW
jgi:hypothetical protein